MVRGAYLMPALYRIRLRRAEREELTALTRRGQAGARQITRARTLLLADQGLGDEAVATALGISARTVQRTRRRAAEEGVHAALTDRARPGAAPVLDGAQQAYLVALATSDPPTGRAVWTMRLLAERLVELEVVPSISDETVRRGLKKTTSSPGVASTGASRA